MKNIIIAIDGPAGSGKTTTAKLVAEHFKYIYIDTGAMYRAVTLNWFRKNKEYDELEIVQSLDDINIELKSSSSGQRTFLNGEDVSDDIRLPEVTSLVSPVSAIAEVRERMVDLQRKLGQQGGVVMDGRDIGTVVFPKADLKIFLIASIEARAKRRTQELILSGIQADEKEILESIIKRDNYDSSRNHSPLRKAEDAFEIDTSEITINEQVKMIIELAEKIIAK